VSEHSEVKRRRREVGAARCARAGAVRMLLCCVPGAEHGPGARPRFGDGSATRPGRYALYFAARRWRATRGAFAVFGQLVMMRGSQTVLMKQNDGAQEGKHMREHIPGAEHGAFQ